MKQFFKSVLATALGTILATAIALFLLPLFFVLLTKGLRSGIEPITKNSLLHIKLSGRIVEKSRPLDFDFFSQIPFGEDERGTGLYELTKALTMAKTDSRIKGLYLELRDVETGWAAAAALRGAVHDFAQSGKFVYAYAETLNERTYYIARAAHKIFLQPSGELEFNGLSITEAFLKGLFEKLEVEPRIFRVGKFKAAVEPLLLEKMSEENRMQNQTLVDDIWSSALTVFRKPGKLEAEELNRIAAGLEITSADDALEAGLVDQLAFEDEVLDLMAEQTVGKDEDPSYVKPGQLLRETQTRSTAAKQKIAILFAEGEIHSGQGGYDSIGSETFVEDLDEARSDEDVKAIVVRINSPGGDALASDVIWRELAITDQEIPVIASLGDVAASGGYYIAAGAREIFAEEGSITGSIGVFGVMFDSERFFKRKLGVNFDRVVSHPYADIGNANRPMTDFEKQKIQLSVEKVYNRFVSVVTESRKLPEEMDPANFAEGRVWSGKRAKDLKLVDHLGGLNIAIERAAELAKLKTYDLDIYPRDREPLERLLEMFSSETAEALLRGTPLESLRTKWATPNFRPGIYARLPFDLRVD